MVGDIKNLTLKKSRLSNVSRFQIVKILKGHISDPHCIQMFTILGSPEFGWWLYFFIFSWEIWSCQLSRATCDCRTRSPPTWRSSSCRRSRLRRAQSRTTPPSSSRASRKISTHTWRTGLPSHSSRSWGPTSWLPRAEWPTLLLAIGNNHFCLTNQS